MRPLEICLPTGKSIAQPDRDGMDSRQMRETLQWSRFAAQLAGGSRSLPQRHRICGNRRGDRAAIIVLVGGLWRRKPNRADTGQSPSGLAPARFAPFCFIGCPDLHLLQSSARCGVSARVNHGNAPSRNTASESESSSSPVVASYPARCRSSRWEDTVGIFRRQVPPSG